jgi:hypothetical protein
MPSSSELWVARVLNRLFPSRLDQPRYLSRRPDKKSARLRSRRLNHLAAGIDACQSYLEIGLREGYTFQDIAVRSRVGVDPEPRFEFRKRLPAGVKIFQDTSDSFFANTRERFDLIFLDGLHEFQQTLRDVLNALEILNDGGLIVVDDSVPIDEFSAIPDQSEALSRRLQSGSNRRDWNGDVFKAVAFLARRPADVGLLTLWSEDDSVQHGQTIVWKKPGFDPSALAAAARDYQAPEYGELFADQRPRISSTPGRKQRASSRRSQRCAFPKTYMVK